MQRVTKEIRFEFPEGYIPIIPESPGVYEMQYWMPNGERPNKVKNSEYVIKTIFEETDALVITGYIPEDIPNCRIVAELSGMTAYPKEGGGWKVVITITDWLKNHPESKANLKRPPNDSR